MRETANPDIALKLEASETKLHDLKSNMRSLGKEAAAAMSAVEAQQQRLTLQRLIAMVLQSALLFNQTIIYASFSMNMESDLETDLCWIFPRIVFKVESERTYHQRVLQILDHLEGEVCSCVTMTCQTLQTPSFSILYHSSSLHVLLELHLFLLEDLREVPFVVFDR